MRNKLAGWIMVSPVIAVATFVLLSFCADHYRDDPVASGRYALTPAFDAGGFYVDGRIECEDGTAPTVDADGVEHCPYTYEQRMRAYNREHDDAYFEGIDDALETWMLLDLELEMRGERKTNGERANIVRQRHGMEEEQ